MGSETATFRDKLEDCSQIIFKELAVSILVVNGKAVHLYNYLLKKFNKCTVCVYTKGEIIA